MKESLQELQHNIASWADELWPTRTAHDALKKLMMEEIPEFAMSSTDPGEYADIVILVLDIATLNGIDVAQAVTEKMAINRARKWQRDPVTGIMKHIKENDDGQRS